MPLYHRRLTAVADALADEVQFTFVLVDDGSSDNTWPTLVSLARVDPRVQPYSLSRNFGHQIALSAGLSQVNGDAVVMMDCDLQHPPELIVEMLARFRAGSDVVQAVRESTEDVSWFKSTTSVGFYRIFNYFCDVKLKVGAADFVMLSRRVYEELRQMPERRRFLRGMLVWLGYPTAYVPYQAPARAAGVSKYNPARMLYLAANALLSFSASPIRWGMRLGLAIACFGLVYLIYIIGRYFLSGDLLQGWASVMSCILILGGTQLLFIGMIGEYIACIFDEIKARPLFLFKHRPEDARGGPADTPTIEPQLSGVSQ